MPSVKIRHIETNKCLTLDIVRRLENKCDFSETNFDKIGQRIYKLRREKHCKNQIVLLRNGRSTPQCSVNSLPVAAYKQRLHNNNYIVHL